jgi:Tfp pilus assembly protein PilE
LIAKKFTLVELFVTIAVMAVLVSLIFPSFKRFQSLAEQTNCKTNMKYMASAFVIYMDDYDNLYPYGLPDF